MLKGRQRALACSLMQNEGKNCTKMQVNANNELHLIKICPKFTRLRRYRSVQVKAFSLHKIQNTCCLMIRKVLNKALPSNMIINWSRRLFLDFFSTYFSVLSSIRASIFSFFPFGTYSYISLSICSFWELKRRPVNTSNELKAVTHRYYEFQTYLILLVLGLLLYDVI